MCLVTIGLSVFNAAPFLADAVQSVLNQTLTDWELLIVDDGSTDDSLAVAQSYTDSRIRVLAGAVNRGLPARLNQITTLTRGRYLARLGADDIMTPDRLQTQVDFMELNPRIDVVSTFAYIVDARNKVYGIRGTITLPTTLSQAAGGVSLIHPTVLARTDWFRQHPYREDCRRAEDYDLWLRTIETASFHVIGQPLLFYRERGLPLSEKYAKTAADVRNTLRLYREMLPSRRFSQLVLASYGKEFAYNLVGWMGQTNWLLHRRNRPLTPEEKHRAQNLLNSAIRSVASR